MKVRFNGDHISTMRNAMPISPIHQHSSNPFQYSSILRKYKFSTFDTSNIHRHCSPFPSSSVCSFYKPLSILPLEELISEDNYETIGTLPIKSKVTSEINLTQCKNQRSKIERMFQSLKYSNKQQLKVIASLPFPTLKEIEEKIVKLPTVGKKTAVFDLDDTLILGYLTPQPNSIPIFARGKIHYIKIRPHAKELIQEISIFYDIIVFTASHREYATQVINLLDPMKIISYAFYADSCLIMNNIVIKDLRILNRSLRSTALIDNSIACMAAQPSNGILVKNFDGSEGDNELVKVKSFLIESKDAYDIRVKIESSYQVKKLIEYTKKCL